jgi:hypothetical protein
MEITQGDKPMPIMKKDVDMKFVNTCNFGNY